MIDNRSIQQSLKDAGVYFGPIDGIIGEKSILAAQNALGRAGIRFTKWPDSRVMIAYQQLMMHNLGFDVGTVDGIVGPSTRFALEQWQNHLRSVPAKHENQSELHPNGPIKLWPTQREVPQFFGSVGANQELVQPAYQFYLYDTRTKVNHISLHKKVAASFLRVTTRVLEVYGNKRIRELHLDRYFGSLNVRKMRGGSSWSMHSWGIAIDFDANRNQLRWGRDKAAFARPEYDDWWAIWEREGWVSLGRERNYDWMHVQAARL